MASTPDKTSGAGAPAAWSVVRQAVEAGLGLEPVQRATEERPSPSRGCAVMGAGPQDTSPNG